MEVNKIDARPLILLDGQDFENLCRGVENYPIVSDFFKQELLKVVNFRMRTDNFCRYKVTPLVVAIVAIAYELYESSPQSISSLIASMALTVFGSLIPLYISDLWRGGSFVGQELRLSRGNMTFVNGGFVINQTPELKFKEYILNKNLPEVDLEVLLAQMKSCLPIGQNELMPFSNIEKELKNLESEIKFLFKIPFAKDTDLGSELPKELWELIAEKASEIHLQNIIYVDS